MRGLAEERATVERAEDRVEAPRSDRGSVRESILAGYVMFLTKERLNRGRPSGRSGRVYNDGARFGGAKMGVESCTAVCLTCCRQPREIEDDVVGVEDSEVGLGAVKL